MAAGLWFQGHRDNRHELSSLSVLGLLYLSHSKNVLWTAGPQPNLSTKRVKLQHYIVK